MLSIRSWYHASMSKETPEEIQQNPANAEKGEKTKEDKTVESPYMKQLFETFCIWCAMPTMFRGRKPDELESKYFIDDESLHELCQIKNLTQFAEHYKIDRNTLTQWKKIVETRDVFQDIRKWVRKVNKNVVASTYRSAMSKDPKAHQDRKLMLQLDGWSEEQNINVKGEGLFDILKKGLDIK